MWELPGPGLKPIYPALAGGFLTTVPPGKPLYIFFREISLQVFSLLFFFKTIFQFSSLYFFFKFI